MYLSTNPNVGMLNKDGTKLVTVLDPESESYKSLRVPAEVADKYIKTRKESMDKANATACSWGLGLLAGCSAIGTTVGHFVKSLGKAEGAALGFAAGLSTCWLPLLFKNSWSADTLATKQFIQENSEKEVVSE